MQISHLPSNTDFENSFIQISMDSWVPISLCANNDFWYSNHPRFGKWSSFKLVPMSFLFLYIFHYFMGQYIPGSTSAFNHFNWDLDSIRSIQWRKGLRCRGSDYVCTRSSWTQIFRSQTKETTCAHGGHRQALPYTPWSAASSPVSRVHSTAFFQNKTAIQDYGYLLSSSGVKE